MSKERFPERIHVRKWDNGLVAINPVNVDEVKAFTEVVEYVRADVAEKDSKEWGNSVRELMIKNNESSSERSD